MQVILLILFAAFALSLPAIWAAVADKARAFEFLTGIREDHSWGSNARRWLSRYMVLLCVIMAIELLGSDGAESTKTNLTAGFVTCAFSLVFFGINVLAIPVMADHGFRPHPKRLLIDILISAISTILSTAYLFRGMGIVASSGSTDIDVWDHLYFSMVTFSTLGYGDFSPSHDARLIAAAEAILGNLHLGMLVAALFYLVTTQTSAKGGGDDDNQSHD